jgi:hypothetical protein
MIDRMSESISVGELRQRAAGTTAPGTEALVGLLGRSPRDERIGLDRAPAAVLARRLRSSRAPSSGSLTALLAVLDDLGDDDVRFGRYDTETEVAIMLIDAGGAVTAASVEPVVEPDSVSAAELAGLLRRSDDAAAASSAVARALAVLDERPDESLRVGRQGAIATSRTFRTKYSIAREKGVTVVGLEDFVDRLAEMGETEIALCSADTGSAVVVAALRPDRSAAIAVLFVTDLRHDGDARV